MKTLASIVLLAIFVSVVPASFAQAPERYDVLITNARIVDGTGNPWFWGSIGIRGGKIAGVGRLNGTAGQTIDARGQIVAPGFIDTDMTRALNEEQRTALTAQVPMARLGSVDDIAAAVLFLCSPAASYITGETLHVNGGMYMA